MANARNESEGRAFPAHYLRTVLIARRAGRRMTVFAGHHPMTGASCSSRSWNSRPAHGGPLVSPWFSGCIASVAERVHREHGRREVLRTWGVGMRALVAEQRL